MLDKVPEIVAKNILETYEGYNNQMLDWKKKFETNKSFKLTRPQSEYVIKYHEVVPKIARKNIVIVENFGEKLKETKELNFVPEKIWCEKLLCETDKAYHIWGKIYESQKNHAMWIPKSAIIQEEKKLNREIDYSPYDNRPPLPHQKIAIEKLLANDRFILADDMGLGKALEFNTLVYTPDGTKKIGEIKIGDKVIGDDGLPHNVTGVFPQGKKELYRVTFNDGYSILCCEDHIWNVSTAANGYNNNLRKILSINLTTKQLMDKNSFIKGERPNSKLQPTYYKIPRGGSKWQIPIVKPINFTNIDKLPIDPYLLGLLIGDGGISGKSIKFSSVDNEIINNIKEILTEDLEIKKVNGDNCDYTIVSKSNNINSLIGKLKELGLMGCTSIDKFIPEIYKYSSIENRLSILQGLMDTDGFCGKSRKNGDFAGTEFCSISEKLVDDVIQIVHSLGGIARKSSRIPKYTYKGEKKEGKRAYRVNIKLQGDMNPFRLERKRNLYKCPEKYKVSRYIKNIEYEKLGDAVCISIDSPNKLYVAEHCIVTHNTTSTIIASLESQSKKILIICPASLKINWQREIEIYSNKKTLIVEGGKWGSTFDFYIINYDIVKNYHTIGEPEIGEEKNTQISSTNFDLAIVDEAHYISNTTAQRTKLINDILSKIPKVWLLTGTPMTSRPINYFNLLRIVNSNVTLDWSSYVRRYCGGYQFTVNGRKIWNTGGATNLEELRLKTKNTILRRLKTDVLDLPDKIISPVFLTLSSTEYDSGLEEFIQIAQENKNKESLSVTINRLMKIRKIISEQKVDYTCEIIDRCLEQGKKVIVFTNFTMALDMLHEKYKKNSVVLDGRMSKEKRQKSVDKFQTEDKIKIFISNIVAGGVGITLTEAEVVIMNDLSFVPAHHSQAEDRAFRYGQKKNVVVYYPIFENTIEKIVYNILQKKKNIIDQVMGDGDFSENFAQSLLKQII